MRDRTFRCLLTVVLVMLLGLPAAAVPPDELAFDAGKADAFRQRNERYTALEQEGKAPGPWTFGAFAEQAIAEASLVPDAGDGKPAFKIVNVSGQPSAMFKPWKPVELGRGTWAARVEYRKLGKTSGRLAASGVAAKEVGVALSPTGDAFQTATLTLASKGSDTKAGLALQLYAGTGEGEALFVRSFRLERTGDVSAETQAAEAQANAARNAEAQAVAQREVARRAAERKPVKGWVRPDAKPVKMDKPLDPPPVTGATYFVATKGDDKAGDGSAAKPWRTIQHGMNQLHPGDLLYVRGGEYRESMLSFPRSGRHDAYITVAGYPGETAKVVHGGGGLAVFNISSGSRWTPVRLEEQAYLVLRDLHIDAVKTNQAVRIQGPMMLDDYKGDLARSRGMIHNIWVTGCDITGGNGNESVLGAGYGAHDVVLSNNRLRDMVGGMNAFVFSDGTIIEFNEVSNTSTEQDDAGAIKSMAPNVIVRYNKVYDNRRSPTAKKPGWAPASEGGKQWRFLQGVSGIYLDFAMVDDQNNRYPAALAPADPANYCYGNTVYGNDAGIFVFKSDGAQVYDNVVYANGVAGTHGFVEGDPNNKRLEFVGPAGHGIRIAKSQDVKVFRNVSFDNAKAGLALAANDVQAWGNVLFGNADAQVHIQKNDRAALGFNTIIATAGQGPPFRRNDEGFVTVEALRQKHPHLEEGTRVVEPEPNAPPLELAKRLLSEQQPDAGEGGAWRQAHERLKAKARQAGIGAAVATVPQAPYDPTGGLQVPLPKALPGTVELENYDVGGPGVSYKDDDGENQGGHYRRDGVDVKANPTAGNGAVVGFTRTGEWIEYTVSVDKAGAHSLSVAYATPDAGRSIRLTLDDKPLGQPITFEPTGSWDELKTTSPATVTLPAGDGVLRVTVESGPVDLDRLVIEPAR